MEFSHHAMGESNAGEELRTLLQPSLSTQLTAAPICEQCKKAILEVDAVALYCASLGEAT